MLDASVCYRALLARDSRFDGLFFVGVSTTGVYCRSVCPARKPRASSCSYHPSAAAAESAGFRPCLRCRPELAPAAPAGQEPSALAGGIVARIQAGYLSDGQKLGDLATSFGISERHLRRLVKEATGVTPIALAQTARLLIAKQLLTETDFSILRVALDSGFSSLRRFNELFANRYGICPRDFRRRRTPARRLPILELRLDYRPPLAWPQLLGFLSARAIPHVESARDGAYYRTVSISGTHGWIRLDGPAGRPEIRVRVSESLSPHLQALLARVRDLLDLNATPDLVDRVLGQDPNLAPGVAAFPGLRVPGAFDGFELAWRAILGQQVSVAGASTLAGRLAERFGSPTEAPESDLRRLTPTSADLAQQSVDAIASIGIPKSRAASILAVARLDQEKPELLSPGSSANVARQQLTALPGIGPWTAEYIAMRALHWPDAFPDTDLALRAAAARLGLRDLRESSMRWRPWRSYAAMHLWLSDSWLPERGLSNDRHRRSTV